GDIGAAPATAEDADIHDQRASSRPLDAFAHEGDLVALRVDRADQEDDRSFLHVLALVCRRRPVHSDASTAANDASRTSTRRSTSAIEMTSGGDRIMLGPEMRTIAPRT